MRDKFKNYHERSYLDAAMYVQKGCIFVAGMIIFKLVSLQDQFAILKVACVAPNLRTNLFL